MEIRRLKPAPTDVKSLKPTVHLHQSIRPMNMLSRINRPLRHHLINFYKEKAGEGRTHQDQHHQSAIKSFSLPTNRYSSRHAHPIYAPNKCPTISNPAATSSPVFFFFTPTATPLQITKSTNPSSHGTKISSLGSPFPLKVYLAIFTFA